MATKQVVTKQYLDEFDRMTAEIGQVMDTFPPTFGLKAFPGCLFRISRRASYVSNGEVPVIML